MKIIRDTLIVLVITLGILVVGEFALRMIFPEKTEKEVNLEAISFEHNPISIISLKPNITREFKHTESNGGHTVTWLSNSLGYRGDEIGKKKGLRIVVYGDSNVHARFTELDKTYSKVLEKYLASTINNDVEVINGGLVGAGPDQSLLRFSEDADLIQPDMLILHVFADNDYGDLIRNRLFELDKDNHLVRNSIVTVDPKLSQDEGGIKNFFNSLLLTRAVIKLTSTDESTLSQEEQTRAFIQKLKRASAFDYSNYKNGGKQTKSHFADHYDIDVATDPDGDAAKIKIMLMHKILERTKVEAEKRDVKLLIVVQPAAFDLVQNNIRVSKKDLQQFPGYNPKNLTNPLKAICKSIDLHCVHLIDGFEKNNPDSLYLKFDNHWNDRGQELAARITSDFIVANKLFK